MTYRHTSLRKMVFTAAITLLLAGCGGGGSSSSTPAQTLSSASSNGSLAVSSTTSSSSATTSAAVSSNSSSLSSSPPNITGKIIDGYIKGATIFWDCNGNSALDTGEPRVQSGAGGTYSIESAPSAVAPLLECTLRAKIPSNAIDEDTGSEVGTPYTMSAMTGNPNIITPLTTLAHYDANTWQQLQSKIPATNLLPIDADYISAGDAGKYMHNAAKYIAVALQSVNGHISNNDALPMIEKAVAFIPDSALNTLDKDAFLAFKANGVPKFNSINPLSATLEPAEFVLNESAFNGDDDPRRAIVLQALSTLNKHKEAIVGNTVYWNLIDASERASWAPNIVGGKNGFTDSEETLALVESLFQKSNAAIAKIKIAEKEGNEAVIRVLTANAVDMFATSTESYIAIIDRTKLLKKATKKLKLGGRPKDIRNDLEKISKYLKKHTDDTTTEIEVLTACSSLPANIYKLNAFNNAVNTSEAIDLAISGGKCAGAMLNSKKFMKIISVITAGKSSLDGRTESDREMVTMLKMISDTVSFVLDFTGLSVTGALYNASIGTAISGMYSLYEVEEASAAAFQKFIDRSNEIYYEFNSNTQNIGAELISQRLSPYIMPKHSTLLEIPTTAEVYKNISITINEQSPQDATYQIDFGDGTTIEEWASDLYSASILNISHVYSAAGSYVITITASKYRGAADLVARDVVTQEITVIENSVPTPSWSLSFDQAGVTSSGGVAIGTPAYSLGKDSKPAISLSGGSKIRIPNSDALKIGAGGATFDLWVKPSVTNSSFAVIAKSHDQNGGVLFLSGSSSGIMNGYWGSFDNTWACTTGIAKSANFETLAPITAGNWIRLTGVIDPNDGFRVYLNKQLSSWCKGIHPSTATINIRDMYIGGFSDYWWPFTGMVQELNIYNSALTDDQIQALQ